MIVGSILRNSIVGQRLTLENNITENLQATCTINGMEILNVIISITGNAIDDYYWKLTSSLPPQTQFQLQRMLL